jgi:hypothetical protein
MDQYQKAAAISAIADVLSNGPRANPSVYWGIPYPNCDRFDRFMGKLSIGSLEFILDRLVSSWG